jgi:glycosyltransferase involved in cell wall biosynthesis
VGHEKGIPDLIRAAAVSALRKLDPLLLCVGGPMDSVPGYEELARALGLPSSATRFVDRVPNTEVPTWLAALDVAAMPYPRDSAQTFVSPLKLYEYMAAGLPIVATDLPGMREVLDNGNAVLVPPGDAEGLGHALARLLSDPQAAAALAEKARRDAAENSWNRRAELALGVAFGGRG